MALLKAGLTALKQKSYKVAIQELEAFCAGSVQTQTKSYCQAQMGLMQAYAATHDYSQSLKACQFLLLCPSTQVQQWAARHSFAVIKTALPEADTDRDRDRQRQRQRQNPGTVPSTDPSSEISTPSRFNYHHKPEFHII